MDERGIFYANELHGATEWEAALSMMRASCYNNANINIGREYEKLWKTCFGKSVRIQSFLIKK